jgi:hypothetical protein
MFRKIIIAAAAMLLTAPTLLAQTKTQTELLLRTARDHREKEAKNFQRALVLAKEKNWPLSFKTPGNNIAFLTGVDSQGYPIYTSTENNSDAAATVGANQLYAGGSLGISLSGSSANMKGKMGIWDGGRVMESHTELIGRVTQKDGVSTFSDHATHVAGTMIASGVNPLAKGMAFGMQELLAYDFSNDVSEMFGEASNLYLSNHSYGSISGWRMNESQGNRWEFWGRFNENEDWKFGAYESAAQLWDSIAYNAPNYLIVKSSGNNRNQTGPAEGQPYFRFDANGNMNAAGVRPPGISSNNGYDIISTYGCAKNILTVGAIGSIPLGYNSSTDAAMSSFSSWGPTDDGRIKPDLVADGVDVLSSVSTSTSSYASFSGTSMATPNTTGALLLLQEYYAQLNSGAIMRSSTLKGLAIHTASEAGTAPGPDYQFGWGVLNVAKAAAIIKEKNTGGNLIQENVLSNGATFNLNVVASGRGPLVATIVWTDPKGPLDPNPYPLNSTTKRLVNDLDMRILQGANTTAPWILDPAIPSAPATRGDNSRDNVEKVVIENPVPGVTYTIRITHKGTLERGLQAYSLLISGAGGTAYCTSAATSTAGARINSVDFAGVTTTNPAGCTSYTNYTATTRSVQPGQSLPIAVQLGACDASVTDKVVKVFIDLNNNGSFADAGELMATSGVINGNGTFNGSIALPSTMTAGHTHLMRIVAQQTSVANDVNPCGNYANGETQDYRLIVAAPSNDLALAELTTPANPSCASPVQYAAIKIRNNGITEAVNTPVSLIVKDGATTVATINSTSAIAVPVGGVVATTLQVPFATQAGKTYTISAVVNGANDQVRLNDTLTKSITISPAPAAPAGAAIICGNNTFLRATAPNPALNYFWYTNATTDSAIAAGSGPNTTVTAPANTFYLGTGASGNVGLPNKEVYPNSGGYLNGTAYFHYTASAPLLLENARMYTKWPGKVRIIVADVTPSPTNPGSFSFVPFSTTDIDVHATSPTPQAGTVATNDLSDDGAVFNLGIVLPAGSHSIIVQPQGQVGLFRNNNIQTAPNLYPMGLPNVLTLTGHSAAVTNPTSLNSFYYFLYNMRVRTLDCNSPRTAVVATSLTAPTITQSGDSLISSATSGNQWYRDGAMINGATGTSYKPTQSGNYSVILMGSLGCQVSSNTITFTTTSIVNVPAAEIGLKVAPNPSKGRFTVQFKVVQRADLNIELVNTAGQVVYRRQQPKFTGTYTDEIAQPSLPAGMYVLRVVHGDKSYTQKIMVQ